MKLRRYLILFGISFLGFLLLWQTCPAQAQGVAPAPGKPAVDEFGSKYCVPCKEMQKVMAALTASYGDQVEFRMVYVDEEKPLFGEYKIVAIPTQVFLNASGKEVDRHMGALSPRRGHREAEGIKIHPLTRSHP